MSVRTVKQACGGKLSVLGAVKDARWVSGVRTTFKAHPGEFGLEVIEAELLQKCWGTSYTAARMS